MGILDEVVADLAAESDSLERFLRDLTPDDWARPTSSPGWSVADQVAHLAWTDAVAVVAMTDPEAFAGLRIPRTPEVTPELMERWSEGRLEVAASLSAYPVGSKMPWFGPPMSATSMATARLMETWAHGSDIRATFGAEPTASARLRHVAHIGVITRGFAFRTNSLEPPTADIHVSLSHTGDVWTWGPPDAAQSINGSALDFCLVVTRRRNIDDVDLAIVGPDARQWMEIAQAFAGPPGPPPARVRGA